MVVDLLEHGLSYEDTVCVGIIVIPIVTVSCCGASFFGGGSLYESFRVAVADNVPFLLNGSTDSYHSTFLGVAFGWQCVSRANALAPCVATKRFDVGLHVHSVSLLSEGSIVPLTFSVTPS